MILGITGGTGSGKTTLLKLIEKQGGLTLDCDEIYHELLKTDATLLAEIENRFPGTVRAGELDRKKLGSIVFADAKALSDLNTITHGAVKKEILRRLEHAPELVAIDAIGLHEGGLAPLCHVTVAVSAPRESRIRRLMERENVTEAYAASRIDAQHSPQWFAERCDHVLDNGGTQEEFQKKCLAFLQGLGIMKMTK